MSDSSAKSDFNLTAPFLIENSRGLVPLSSLSALLPRFLGNSVDFHEAARRLFIGNVATQINAKLDSSNPPRLVLNFSDRVNPTISTEPGKLRMIFAREPVVPPGSMSLTFDSGTITQATFAENNGTADLTVSAAAPLRLAFLDLQSAELRLANPVDVVGRNCQANVHRLWQRRRECSRALAIIRGDFPCANSM